MAVFDMNRLRFLPLLPPPPPPLPLLPESLDYFFPPPPPPPPLPRFEELIVRQPNGQYHGRDIFGHLSTHEMDFWAMTGETVESFQEMAEDIRPLVDDGFGRPHMLSVENRLLMTFIWLKKYPDMATLSMIFDVNGRSVARDIHCMVNVLWDYVQNGIRWPRDEEWLALHGQWATMPNVVGAIDGTVHIIYAPG